MDKINEDKRLLSTDPLHSGNSKIPIAEGVVFPNINKHEYIGKLLNQVIQATKVFFWDDLNPQSDICQDASGQCFSNALQHIPATFSIQSDTEQVTTSPPTYVSLNPD